VYPLTPLKLYMLDSVRDDPACVTRMERMLEAIGRDRADVTCITQENIGQVVEELDYLCPPDTAPPDHVRTYMRPLVFSRMPLGDERPDLTPLLERCPEGTKLRTLESIYCHIEPVLNQHPYDRDQRENMVCWPTYNLGTMIGCPHGCHYCGAGKSGKFISIALNLEEYMEQSIGPAIEKYPWHKCWRMIRESADLIAFEPEYGLFDLFTRKLAEYDGRYGHFHTTSANVDWIADLPHRDRLIGVWSTTCEAVARDIEPGAGAAIERIDAARKCQEMGVSIRYKFKPVIPVRNWREEYAAIIEQTLKRSRPESIGFCMLAWMSYEEMAKRIDTDLLDEEYVAAARDAAEELRGTRTGPFPHAVRADVYRFLINEVRRWDEDVLLYVSTESREMWDELKDELGQDPRAYVCACSSVAVPGGRLALSPDIRYSTYSPTPT